MMTASVSGSFWNSSSASMCVVPISGSPPMPMHVDWPEAAPRQLVDRFVGQRAALRDDADAAFLADVRGNDAGFALARRDDPRAVRADQPRVRMVLQERHRLEHVHDRNALGDADDERDARVGGFHDGVGGKRRRHEDHRGVGAGFLHGVGDGVEHRPAFVRRAALAGRDAADDVGVVRGAALAWKVPSRPVRPWTMRRVFESSRIAISGLLPRQRHDLRRGFAHRVGGREVQPALSEHPLSFLDVRAFHANDDRNRHAQFLHRRDHAGREHVAAQDAAEDVDEHGLHVLVGHQDLERVANLLGIGAAAHVEEVRRHRPPTA